MNEEANPSVTIKRLSIGGSLALPLIYTCINHKIINFLY